MKNRKLFFAACAAVGAVAMCGSAFAQDTTTTTTTVTTQGTVAIPEVNWANRISVGDEIFIMDLVHANAREIILSRIAEHMADSHGVAAFAHHMVVDHEALQDQLLSTYGSQPWMHNWQMSYGRRMDPGNTYKRQGEEAEDNAAPMNHDMDHDQDRDRDWGRGWANWDWNRADVNWRYIFPTDWNDIHKLSTLNGYAFDNEYVNMMAIDHANLIDKINMHNRETRNTAVQSLISNVGPQVQSHLEEARNFAFAYTDPFDIDRDWPWIH